VRHRPDDDGNDGDDRRVRLDKWLWAARFYKTRALAAEEIDRGRVEVNGQPAKPGRTLKPGDVVLLRQGHVPRSVVVVALSLQRGPAAAAAGLYRETAESVAERERVIAQRRSEPAQSIEQGRPTKRDRRELADWTRWSAEAPGDD
jgi:ribosome-associated heat shock protein Hsp15